MPAAESFHCYLLSSVRSPRSLRCYIGFTTHPQRRIRQHNGELLAGAKRTSKHRPWKYLVVISGFPNKVVALQFEWQFQHPLESRIVRSEMNVHQRWSKGWRGKLELLALLTEIRLWSQLRLSLNFLDENAYRWFRLRFPSNPTKISLLGSVGDLPVPVPRVVSEAIQRCFLCSRSDGLLWRCSSCETVAHLFCTALQSKTPSLIPTTGDCPQCRVTFPWGEIVRLTINNQHAAADVDSQRGCERGSSSEDSGGCSEEEDEEEAGEESALDHCWESRREATPEMNLSKRKRVLDSEAQ